MIEDIGAEALKTLRGTGKIGLSRALALMESDPDGPAATALLDAAYADPRGHVLGLTGPPGVGKSTLINALIRHWRDRGETVGVVAVDPTSRSSRGALLGDRTRLKTDPEDDGIYIRSMAARDRLGGLAELTFPAVVLMRALFDHVIVETVGVGQSETDVGRVADTVAFCIQPASGDSLQFMKAGIMEVPDIFSVTKADIGAAAQKAAADVEGALSLAAAPGDDWTPPVLTLSAERQTGMDAFLDAVEAHRHWLSQAGRLAAQRAGQAEDWLRESVRERFGSAGMAVLDEAVIARDVPFFITRQRVITALKVVWRAEGG